MKAGFVAATALVCLFAGPARADLPRARLDEVGVKTPRHAALPAALRLRAADGRSFALTGSGGPPRVLVFADYRCVTLCGPALSIVAARLRETGLTAARDYQLEVVGLDPASTPGEAASFGAQRAPEIAGRAMLTGDAAAISAATGALGYRYVYDPSTRTYAHPIAAFVLTADGRLSRTLSEVALTAPDLKQAILDAGAGEAPNLMQSIVIACHGALAAVGRFDGAALLGLRAGGVLTVLAGALGLGLLLRRGRRPA